MGKKKRTPPSSADASILEKVRKIVNAPQPGVPSPSSTSASSPKKNLSTVSSSSDLSAEFVKTATGGANSLVASLFGNVSSTTFIAPGAPTGNFVMSSFSAGTSPLGVTLKEFASRVVMMLETGVETGASFASTWESIVATKSPDHLFDLRPMGPLFSLLFFHLVAAEKKFRDLERRAALTRSDALAGGRTDSNRNAVSKHVQQTLEQVNEKLDLLIRSKGARGGSASGRSQSQQSIMGGLQRMNSVDSMANTTSGGGSVAGDQQQTSNPASTTAEGPPVPHLTKQQRSEVAVKMADDAISALADIDENKALIAEVDYGDLSKALGDVRKLANQEAMRVSGDESAKSRLAARLNVSGISEGDGDSTTSSVPAHVPRPPFVAAHVSNSNSVSSLQHGEGDHQTASGSAGTDGTLTMRVPRAEVGYSSSPLKSSKRIQARPQLLALSSGPLPPYTSPSQIRRQHTVGATPYNPTGDDGGQKFDPRFPVRIPSSKTRSSEFLGSARGIGHALPLPPGGTSEETAHPLYAYTDRRRRSPPKTARSSKPPSNFGEILRCAKRDENMMKGYSRHQGESAESFANARESPDIPDGMVSWKEYWSLKEKLDERGGVEKKRHCAASMIDAQTKEMADYRKQLDALKLEIFDASDHVTLTTSNAPPRCSPGGHVIFTADRRATALPVERN